MKKTAKRYTKLQLFLRKLLPSFILSVIIVSLITALAVSAISRNADNLNSSTLNLVSEKLYDASERYSGELPEENPMYRNYLEFMLGVYSGALSDTPDDLNEDFLGKSVFFLVDAQTKEIAAEPGKCIYLLDNDGDGKGFRGIYKADESVTEKLENIRTEHPRCGYLVQGAYTSPETGKFIPDIIEIKDGDNIIGTVNFSDTDKKDYSYSELGKKSNIKFMMYDTASDTADFIEKKMSEIPLTSDITIYADDIFSPVPYDRVIGFRTENRKYLLVYANEGNIVNALKEPDALTEFFGVLLFMTLFIAWAWSFREYAELKAHYDTEDFRKELTNTMAHDLKTPLMAASGYAENLLDGTNPDKNTHYAEGILENIRHMDKIISDVLELSKLESGSDILNRTQVSLKALAEDTGKKYCNAAEERNLTVTVTGNAVINADEVLMKRAIENLVSNAVKYAEEGSEIKISISDSRLAVENRFSGADIADADELLKPFVKGDKSRSSKKGSGLGLSIVKNICDMHGFRFKITASGGVFTAEASLSKQ